MIPSRTMYVLATTSTRLPTVAATCLTYLTCNYHTLCTVVCICMQPPYQKHEKKNTRDFIQKPNYALMTHTLLQTLFQFLTQQQQQHYKRTYVLLPYLCTYVHTYTHARVRERRYVSLSYFVTLPDIQAPTHSPIASYKATA